MANKIMCPFTGFQKECREDCALQINGGCSFYAIAHELRGINCAMGAT